MQLFEGGMSDLWMWLIYRIRIVAKTWLARHTTIIEFCDDCGVR
jgi:hypothetical protein